MKETLTKLRKKAVIGFVGGSDISKQYEQLGESRKYKKKGRYMREKLRHASSS